MNNYTKEELGAALRAIISTIVKCEKVLPKRNKVRPSTPCLSEG